MSRAPAQIRRPSSSRRGWPTSSARTTGGTAGSEADPTGFQPLRSSPCFAKRRLLNRPGHAQLGREGLGALVRDVFLSEDGSSPSNMLRPVVDRLHTHFRNVHVESVSPIFVIIFPDLQWR